MKRPICVRSSVQVTAPQSFNQWQQDLAEEREFLRLIDKNENAPETKPRKMNIETIQVSACRGAFDRNTYDVNLLQWLESVRPEYPRTEWEKKQLPAIMPHGLF